MWMKIMIATIDKSVIRGMKIMIPRDKSVN